MADSMAVEHDQGSCMFRLPLDTGECACLQYRIEESSGSIWDCYHTEVPPSQQGKGLGGGRYWNNTGGAGGSGIVIIRYADSYIAATSTTGSPTITVAGGYRVYKFTGSGSITF